MTAEEDGSLVQLQYKVTVLGDGTVGKTSVCMRFTEDYFAAQYKQTVGLDFFIKNVVLPGDVQVALQIWDIGGQSISSKMIRNYIYGSHAILLVYDITNYESFQNLADWLKLVHEVFPKGAEAPAPHIALIGNKKDLEHLRTVSVDKHMRFAGIHKLSSYFMSAKSADAVHSCFFRVAADLANVVLSKAEIDTASKVMEAQIVNHPRNDPTQPEMMIEDPKSKCLIQ